MLAPENELLVTCARLDLRACDRVRIRELLDGGLDWRAVLLGAERHGLKPLLHRHLAATPMEGVPKAALADLWATQEQALRRNRAMGRELLRILDHLEQAGIPALPYKGPTLACLAYADIGLREFCDLDILVPRADVERAGLLLQGLGYSPAYTITAQATRALLRARAHYHFVFRGPHAVELHWRSDADFPVERDDAGWWAGLPRTRFLDGTVRAFDRSDLLLVLCFHGSKHRWESLGWLVDVAELLRAQPVDAAAVAARARTLDGERRLYLGLRLARDLLAAPIPGELAAGCERPDVVSLAHGIGREIFHPPAPGAWPALGRELALHAGPWRKARRAWEVVVDPTFVEWTRWPLPRWMFFLYPVLRLGRLAVKYLIRSPRTPPAATPRTPPPQPRSTG
jgi:hypothetical protein